MVTLHLGLQLIDFIGSEKIKLFHKIYFLNLMVSPLLDRVSEENLWLLRRCKNCSFCL